MNKRVLTLHFLEEFLGVLVMAVALFWSAGRLDWPAAWAAIGVWVAWYAAMDLLVLRYQPDLLAERLKPPEGAKKWDKLLMSTVRLLTLARYILAGLDQRYGWTSGFPPAAQLAGLAVCLLSASLFTWAMYSNRFFSQVVRLQTERGQTVATGGPYRFVRHPGNLAMILFDPAMSTLLASWPAILAGGVIAILLVVRTALEDRDLLTELPGYADYASRVKYRLVPRIW